MINTMIGYTVEEIEQELTALTTTYVEYQETIGIIEDYYSAENYQVPFILDINGRKYTVPLGLVINEPPYGNISLLQYIQQKHRFEAVFSGEELGVDFNTPVDEITEAVAARYSARDCLPLEVFGRKYHWKCLYNNFCVVFPGPLVRSFARPNTLGHAFSITGTDLIGEAQRSYVHTLGDLYRDTLRVVEIDYDWHMPWINFLRTLLVPTDVSEAEILAVSGEELGKWECRTKTKFFSAVLKQQPATDPIALDRIWNSLAGNNFRFVLQWLVTTTPDVVRRISIAMALPTFLTFQRQIKPGTSMVASVLNNDFHRGYWAPDSELQRLFMQKPVSVHFEELRNDQTPIIYV